MGEERDSYNYHSWYRDRVFLIEHMYIGIFVLLEGKEILYKPVLCSKCILALTDEIVASSMLSGTICF